VIAVAWIGRNLQPGGAGSPLGVPIVNVSNKALREAMTFLAERAGTEFERLLLAEADQCGKRAGSDQRDCSGADPARVFDQRRHQSMICCRADRREPGYGGFVQRQPYARPCRASLSVTRTPLGTSTPGWASAA
jgi:hypothetical protein